MPVQKFQRQKMPWRVVVYSVVIVYLFIDLYWLKGPLYRHFNPAREMEAEVFIPDNVVAAVNRTPITTERLEKALTRYLFRTGRARDTLNPDALRSAYRMTLEQVIDDELIRQATRFKPPRVPPEEVEAAAERFRDQFPTQAQFAARLAREGLTEETLRRRIVHEVFERAWVENHIRDTAAATPEQARPWFASQTNLDPRAFEIPERLRARHIFLSIVETPEDEQKTKIDAIHSRLTAEDDPADFATLAAELSEDERSMARGGDLDWFSRKRMPEDFSKVVFALPPGQVSKPFRTAIGWHIAEVLERQPARPAAFEEVQAEVIAHLEAQNRARALKELMRQLKERHQVYRFPEHLPKETR